MIVKVKQQDALLKKEAAKVKTDSSSPAVSSQDATNESNEKLKAAEKELEQEREKRKEVEEEIKVDI